MQLPVTNPNPASGETRVNIYGYVPSFSLGLATVVLFALFLLSHLFFLVQSRRQQKRQRGIATFETLFIIGCILEIVGYSFRLASHAHPYVLRNFILNYFMIVVVSFHSSLCDLCHPIDRNFWHQSRLSSSPQAFIILSLSSCKGLSTRISFRSLLASSSASLSSLTW